MIPGLAVSALAAVGPPKTVASAKMAESRTRNFMFDQGLFFLYKSNSTSVGAVGMEEHFTIGQLAKSAGVPTTTVRYYERIGLVESEGRSSGNYRIYGAKSLDKLNFIRAAQAIGFTLDDARVLLGDGGKVPRCGEVKALIETRLADVAARMKDLKHVQQVLKSAHEQCAESDPRCHCHVLKALGRD
jgi:MerR family mercuric resistance operon transcriptional regulator